MPPAANYTGLPASDRQEHEAAGGEDAAGVGQVQRKKIR
jgi:hypothetical protein